MDHSTHDKLETWQVAIGLLTAILGLVYYVRRKPAAAAEPILQQPTGPAGFGEVGGGGGFGAGSPASPTLTGQQSPPGAPKALPVGEPGPGEGQAQWERGQQGTPANRAEKRRLAEGEQNLELKIGRENAERERTPA